MRGVGADAERQRQDDHGRPALGVQQHAHGVTKILEHSCLRTATYFSAAGPHVNDSAPRRLLTHQTNVTARRLVHCGAVRFYWLGAWGSGWGSGFGKPVVVRGNRGRSGGSSPLVTTGSPSPEPRAPSPDVFALACRMLNYIWFGLMAIALVVAAFNGTAEAVTKGAVDSA